MPEPLTRTRTFTLADQEAFARLSGDRNPLHVDPVAARRLLFGAAVVHGVHLVLWALDTLAAESGITALEGLQANFDMPVPVGEMATLEITPGAEARATIQAGGRRAARLRFRNGQTPAPWANPGAQPEEICAPLDAVEIATAAGDAPLGFDSALRSRLFPALEAFAGGQIAWILASTRIVGMRVPGLDSIFVGLKGQFRGPAAALLSYRVTRWDDRFDLAEIALESGGVTGSASALRRPRPGPQAPLAAIKAKVAAERFAGASVLVIGGSRGLGEAAAKVFAAGGAKVTFTYREGQAEAEALLADIPGAEAIRLDTADPGDALTAARHQPFTHVVYCAAPRIRKGGTVFDQAAYDRYVEVFAKGLGRVLDAAEPHLARAVTLLVPSTIYAEREEPGFAEYATAKLAGEAVARDAAAEFRADGRTVTLLQPRFDRLRTDQTAAPGGSDAADPVDALLVVLP